MKSGDARRILQNFVLIWLDANFDASKKYFETSLERLRGIVGSITTFTDADQCVDFLSEVQNEMVFMIISGSLGQFIIPLIHEWPQLDSIYVLCENQSIHEQWNGSISKIKGVHTDIEPIYEKLRIDCKRADRNLISISYYGIDPLFMYTQLLKEALLDIDDDIAKSIEELVAFCKLDNGIQEDQIKLIEQEYNRHTPIWWYTAPYFIYSMLNRGLREMDTDIIMKMGFFIRDLHKHRSCSEIMHTHMHGFTSKSLETLKSFSIADIVVR